MDSHRNKQAKTSKGVAPGDSLAEVPLEDLDSSVQRSPSKLENFAHALTMLDRLILRVFILAGGILEKAFGVKIKIGTPAILTKSLPLPLLRSFLWFFQNGLITEFYRHRPFVDDPYFPQYTLKISAGGLNLWSNGIAETEEGAITCAIGEAIERYSQSLYSKKNLIRSTSSGLKSAVDPLLFSGPSEKQRHQPGWREWQILDDSIFCWVKGESLISGNTKWVPAQMVFKPYQYESGEPIINLPITSGAAAALSQDEAVLHGIAELVEREAFMVTYLNRLSPPRLDLSSSEESLRNYFLLFKRRRLDIEVYNLPTDAPLSVMLAVITDKTGKGPAISVGARADFNPVLAAKKAILEASHTRVAIRRDIENGVRLPKDNSEVVLPSHHALFWASRSRLKNISFLEKGDSINAPKRGNALNLKEILDKTIGFFRAKEFEVIWVDLTPSQFRKAGIFSGKIIIPGLHPLFIDERYPYYGGKRLRNLPVELGYLAKPLAEEELNRIPHPFP